MVDSPSSSSCPFHQELSVENNNTNDSRPRKIIRIRITNATSHRSKTVICEFSDENNLYETVYDCKSVKDAHIRKWGKEVASKVKSKSFEIQCAIWNDKLNEPIHWFTIDDLKSTSTQQLCGMVSSESNGADENQDMIISLVLQCVPCRNNGQQPQQQQPIPVNGGEDEIGLIPDMDADGTASSENVSSSTAIEKCPFSGGGPLMMDSNTMKKMKSFKCPFLGIDIDSSVMDEFKARMADKTTTVDRASEIMEDFQAKLSEAGNNSNTT